MHRMTLDAVSELHSVSLDEHASSAVLSYLDVVAAFGEIVPAITQNAG